jgi:D-3-phosphoglycerate dehydrogenase
MATMHAYHVSSAKDDFPDVWRVNEALLKASPHLLAVSTYGASYDKVDVPACPRSGVCVFNQTGSNARAVAEQTLGMTIGQHNFDWAVGISSLRLGPSGHS